MNQKSQEYKLFKEEIEELTFLLNNEWLDLKKMIQEKGVNLTGLYLVGYYEDDIGNEYGLLLTKEKKIKRFTAKGKKIKIEEIEKEKDIQEEFPQIIVALDLQ